MFWIFKIFCEFNVPDSDRYRKVGWSFHQKGDKRQTNNLCDKLSNNGKENRSLFEYQLWVYCPWLRACDKKSQDEQIYRSEETCRTAQIYSNWNSYPKPFEGTVVFIWLFDAWLSLHQRNFQKSLWEAIWSKPDNIQRRWTAVHRWTEEGSVKITF